MRGWLCSVGLLVACGDERLSASGVDAHVRIVDLDEASLKEICHWVSDCEYERDREQECAAAAVNVAWEDGLDKDGCERVRDDCTQHAPARREAQRADELTHCERETLAKPREGCTSTVGELERCHRDRLRERAQYAQQFTCARIETFVGMPDLYPPDSCADVARTCYPMGGLEDN